MINPIPELTPLLKQLRLSGMTDSLAIRNREAIDHQLSYPDFLALMVQDEVARRDQKKYTTRLRRAGFRGNKTLENFDLNANPNLNRAYINELADCRFIDEHVAVLIAGPCGTGKSHLAQAIGHCAVQKGIDVLFFTQAKLLANLHAARATNTYEKRFQTLAKVDLLIIDDFALQPMDSVDTADIYELIVERHRAAATVITSNREPVEWLGLMADPLLAQSAIDRLQSAAHELVLDGESYRQRQKPIVTEALDELPPARRSSRRRT